MKRLAFLLSLLLATSALAGEKIVIVQGQTPSGGSDFIQVDSSGHPLMMSHGVISSVNSSTTPLTDGATFTGTSESTIGFTAFYVFVDTDTDGTLYIDFSSDGTNWDRTKTVVVDQTDGNGSTHGFAVASPYMRVRYTDTSDSSTQSWFRLQTTFSQGQPFLSSAPNQKIGPDGDVQLVRVVNDPEIDVERGLYHNKYGEAKFGVNEDIGTSAFEDIWAAGGTLSWMTAAETFRVKAGGDAADTAAGAGCREVTIVYLDANWVEQTEALATAGASASAATSSTGFRVQRAYCSASGTYGAANTATITIENTSSGATQATISAGLGQSEKTQYTVPANHRAIVKALCYDVEAAKPIELRFWQRQSADDVSAPLGSPRIVRRVLAAVGESCLQFPSPRVFPEKTDLWVSAKASSAGGASKANVTYEMELIRGDTVTIPQ